MKYDWEEIQERYVAGGDDVTLAALHEQYGCAMSTLKEHSRKEKWESERGQFRDQVRTKTQDLATTAEAEIRAHHIQVAQDLIEPALERLKSLNPDDLSPAEVRLFIKDACEIERRAAGIPDAREVQAIIKAEMEKEIEAFIEDLREKLPHDVVALIADAADASD